MKKYHLIIVLLIIAVHAKAQFNTLATGNSTTTNARYFWAGNVGIGTAQNVVPSEKLHVIGNVLGTGNLIFGTTASTGLLHLNSTTNNFTLRVNAMDRFSIVNTSGHVGIGTPIASIVERLHVTGNTRTSGNFITDAGVLNVPGTTLPISFRANDVVRMTISNSGNVGIGTATPSEMLHVNSSARATRFNSGTGLFSTIGATNLSLSTNSLATDGTGGTVWATILNSNGYLGIGTAAPSEMLHINSSARATRFNSSTGIFSSVGAINLSFNTNASSTDGTGGSTWMTILNSGNVGIGNTATAPVGKFQVDVTSTNVNTAAVPLADHGLFLKNTNNTVNNLNVIGFGNSAGTSVANVGVVVSEQTATGAGSLFFSTKPTTGAIANRMIINSVGNVGIGTTLAGLSSSADYKLAVNGKILAKDLQIQVTHPTWADYVFEDSYKLPSLSEVEQYIKENKHLKEVPSAKTVEENGYSVNELDVILLKKVEELTLYVIAQQKEIEALKKEMAKKKN